MAFQAPFDIVGMRNQQMREDVLRQEQQRYNQKMLFDGLEQLGGAYSDWSDKRSAIGAMDKGVGLMSDIGAIQPDIRDKFMNLNEREKPFVFDLLRQGMFAPYAAGQSAVQQARGWADNRGAGGGGMPGGAANSAVRVYFGP